MSQSNDGRPIGTTPITDAASINAPENRAGSDYASNADLRVEGDHRHDAAIAEYAEFDADEEGVGEGGIESEDALIGDEDYEDEEDEEIGGLSDRGGGPGSAGFPISDELEGDVSDEESYAAQEAEYGAGTEEDDANTRLGQ